MARSTATLLAQLERFLPPGYAPYRPVLAGLAAMMREAEIAGDSAKASGTLAGAVAEWLDLHAHGHGIRRALDESDAQLAGRIQNPEDQVTRAAILSAADRILVPYTDVAAVMIEGWEYSHLDIDFWLDFSPLNTQKAFVLIVPLIGDAVVGDSYFDSDYADNETYAGEGIQHPVYGVILREVQRIRAAGVKWWLLIDTRVAESDKTFADNDYYDDSYAVP